MIVANPGDPALDPLDGHSSNSSDRSILTTGGEVIGWNNVLALTNYCPRFKELRGILTSATSSNRNIERY